MDLQEIKRIMQENEELKARMRWIPVEERLPEIGEVVSVICRVFNTRRFDDGVPDIVTLCDEFISAGRVDEDGQWYVEIADYEEFEVVYWIALPKTPEAKNE